MLSSSLCMPRAALFAATSLVFSAMAHAQTPPVRTWSSSTESVVFYECSWRADKLAGSERKSFLSKCMTELSAEVEGLRQSMITAEKAMADTYREVQSKFVPQEGTNRSALLAAQRQWVKYREAHCVFEVEWVMGKYESAYLYTKCALTEATKREAYLKSLLQ
jgi:uncharacterized protein YecT (DUF1311 family)